MRLSFFSVGMLPQIPGTKGGSNSDDDGGGAADHDEKAHKNSKDRENTGVCEKKRPLQDVRGSVNFGK